MENLYFDHFQGLKIKCDPRKSWKLVGRCIIVVGFPMFFCHVFENIIENTPTRV